MPHFYAMLQPVEGVDEPAYYIEDVLHLFTPARRTTFEKWLEGRTVMVINDRGAIYKHELEEFFESVLR